MSFGRKDSEVEMGAIKNLIKIVFHFVCVLTIMSLMVIPLVQSGTAEYYVLILTLTINSITVVGIGFGRYIIRKIIKKIIKNKLIEKEINKNEN